VIAVTDAARRLLAGETVTIAEGDLVLDDAVLDAPRPLQQPVPLLAARHPCPTV
jgi:hypothetical protein